MGHLNLVGVGSERKAQLLFVKRFDMLVRLFVVIDGQIAALFEVGLLLFNLQ